MDACKLSWDMHAQGACKRHCHCCVCTRLHACMHLHGAPTAQRGPASKPSTHAHARETPVQPTRPFWQAQATASAATASIRAGDRATSICGCAAAAPAAAARRPASPRLLLAPLLPRLMHAPDGGEQPQRAAACLALPLHTADPPCSCKAFSIGP